MSTFASHFSPNIQTGRMSQNRGSGACVWKGCLGEPLQTGQANAHAPRTLAQATCPIFTIPGFKFATRKKRTITKRSEAGARASMCEVVLRQCCSSTGLELLAIPMFSTMEISFSPIRNVDENLPFPHPLKKEDESLFCLFSRMVRTQRW